MAQVTIDIKHYQISWRQLERRKVGDQEVLVRAQVRCTGLPVKGEDEHTLDVVFVAPESPLPPASFVPAERKANMYMPIADLMPFVDMLRNEKPIYAVLYDTASDLFTVLTNKEPIGENETPRA